MVGRQEFNALHGSIWLAFFYEYEAYKQKTFMSLIAMQPLVPDHAYIPHMKAIHVSFKWLYGSLICNQRLQRDSLRY